MSVPRALEVPELRRCQPLRSLRLPAAGGTYRVVLPKAARESGSPASGGRAEPPYWASVWPASIALFRMLMRGPRLDGVHAVDVGCGIGLPGLAAGLRGARVSFLDREATALRFAAFNAAELGIRDFETRVFDWDRDELPASADLLLLADVAYQYRHLAPLRRLCEQVLAVPGGRVLLADPERPTANDLVAALAAHAARVGSAAAEDPSSGDRVALRIVEVGGGPA